MANETIKVLGRIKGMLSGRGLDLGCGPYKITPECVGVDEGQYDGVVESQALKFLKTQGESTFNWIFSSHYFEHEKNIIPVLQECERVLRNNGRLIVYLPDRRVYINERGNDANSDHVNHWTPGEFADILLSNTNLEIRSLEQRNTTPPNHKFTGDGTTENPKVSVWEYSFLLIASKEKR